MLSFLVRTIISLAIIVAVGGFARTWQVEKKENQKIFLGGSVPDPLPSGLYTGSIGHETSWVGKKFNANDKTGINIFRDGSEKFPFKTYVGKGARDQNLNVLKIDYDTPDNPFWARFILDEVVEVSPGKYLGKLELMIIPGYPFALGFFRLNK